MKKLIAILFTAVLPGMGNAQRSVSALKVPAAVIKSFTDKYPGQHVKKWELEDSVYCAICRDHGTKFDACFLSSGNWLQTYWEIGTKKLPEPVRQSIKNSPFANWRIDESEKVQTKMNQTLI